MFPKYVNQSRIEAMREQQKANGDADLTVGAETPQQARARAMQRDFLEVLAKSLSVKAALDRTGVNRSQYQNWRSSDPNFCEALNEVISEWREELLGSAISRAIGYTTVDSDGNLATDASGKVVYQGGSDQLARALLQLGNGDGKQGTTVQVNINLEAAGYDEALAPKVVDAEFTQID